MIIFLISSSYFTNFLEIFLSLEKGFIALCVQLQGVPSNYLSVPRVVRVCCAGVTDWWGQCVGRDTWARGVCH
jgi:hypothetical protein